MKKFILISMLGIFFPVSFFAQSVENESLFQKPAQLALAGATVQQSTSQPKSKESKSKPDNAGKKDASEPMNWGTDYWRGTGRLNWWDAGLSGNIESISQKNGQLIGESIDLTDVLNMNTPASVFEFEVWARPSRRNRLIGAFSMSQYYGSVDNIPAEVVYDGDVFPANSSLKSKIASAHGALYYQFLPFANERGGVGPLVGLEYWGLSTKLEAPAQGIKAEQKIDVPVPVIGLAGDYTFGYGIGAWGKFGWMGTGGSGIGDVKFNYIEFDGGFNFKWKLLYAGLGYHYILLDASTGKSGHDGYTKFNLSQSGPMASLGVNF